jgi:glycosyltransferase involved in cell wall biosynthesis
MLVSYHNLSLYNEPFIDGANLYSIENSKLIKEFNGSEFVAKTHDIRDVLSGKESLLNLKSDGVVVSNAGPYAFAYHYMREKKGLKFRIVRDVQTSLWQGYLLQEKLCGQYTREGDAILFLSEFQRQLFIKLFPESLNKGNTFVCAPFMHFFPENPPKKESDYDGLTLGWVGRVTVEKGFHNALESFISLKKQMGKVRMIIAGGRTGKRFEKYIQSKLRKNGIGADAFIRLNNGMFEPHALVWDAYKKFDIFLFPSVSTNESLGRVIVEAAYCNVPVIAAHYAAAPELLSKKNLVPVEYKKDFRQLVKIATAGFTVPEDITAKVVEHKRLEKKAHISGYMRHDLKYINILKGKQKKENCMSLDKNIREFIDGINIYHGDECLTKDESFMRMRKFLLNENYATLSMWNSYINAYMRYNPCVQFFANEKKPFSKRCQIKMQKLTMFAKTPIKTPLKKYYYFKRKQSFKKYGY